MTAQLRLATSTDVAETVPMLMGYVPSNQVIAVCLASQRVACTIAVELTPHIEGIMGRIVPALDACGATGTIIVAYSDQVEAHMVAATLADRLNERVKVLDSIIVTSHTITSLDTGECEPRSATPSAAQVQAIVAGLAQPAASRDEVRARYMYDPEHVAQRQKVAPITTSRPLSIETLHALNQPMSAEIAARLGHALTEDELTQQWATMPMKLANEALSLWAEVATYYSDSEPTPEADRILSLCGLCAFLAGNGVALPVILDRLHARTRAGVMHPSIDPTRRLLDTFSRGSVSPSNFAAARERVMDDLI